MVQVGWVVDAFGPQGFALQVQRLGRWKPLRASFFQQSGLPADPNDIPGHLAERLNKAYDLFLKTAPDNSYATVDQDGWHLSTDPAETLDTVAQTRLGELKNWLTQQMRTIRLPDLLIEVDNDLRFTNHFMPPTQQGGREAEGVCTLLAHAPCAANGELSVGEGMISSESRMQEICLSGSTSGDWKRSHGEE